MVYRILCSLFFVLFMSLPNQAHASQTYTSNNVPELEKRYVYSLVANIRSGVGTDAEVVDKLACGDEITILENKEEEERINGVSGYWLKVSYTKGGEQKEGYLWQGNLSYTQLRRGDVKRVFGLDNEAGHNFNASVRAVRSGIVVSEKSFKVGYGNTGYIGGGFVENTGLKNADQLIELNFSGAACGTGDESYYFIWTGKQLLYLIDTTSGGDAEDDGVHLYRESLIFPKQSGASDSGLLIKLIGSGKEDQKTSDEVKDNGEAIIWKYKAELYHWDGANLTPIDQNWKD